VTSRSVDCWIPKSIIRKSTPSDETILIPKDHASQTPHKPPKRNNPLVKGNSEVIKQAKEWQGRIAIEFPYSVETLNNVKTLDGRRFHPDGKYWTAELKSYSILKLKEWGFELDDSLAKHIIENLEKGKDRPKNKKIKIPKIE